MQSRVSLDNDISLNDNCEVVSLGNEINDDMR